MKTSLPFSKTLLAGIAFFIFTAQVNAQQNATTKLYNPSTSILDCTVKAEASNVQLKWSSENEKNLSHFIIERSFDANEFGNCAVIFGAEIPVDAENFSYTDKQLNAASGLVYYRLKIVEKSGAITYSQTFAVQPKESGKANVSK